jgi:phosphoribosylformylglycinamidine synthase
VCPRDDLKRLEDEDRIALRYLDNPNGSIADIAAVLGAGRNVLGVMPHPERAADPHTGGTDGRPLLQGLIEALA